jgi:hypothetical protein
MSCADRQSLLSDYSSAAQNYANTVRKMTELVDLGLMSEVDVLRRTCRSTWDAAERARLALSRHEANHGCDRSDFVASAAASAG